MLAGVLPRRDANEIGDPVVALVVVSVVDVVTVWYGAHLGQPLLSMEADGALRLNRLVCPLVVTSIVAVPPLAAPLNALIAHTRSPV
jgi:hypothetical protein